eukprot:gene37767-46599_t
MALVGHVSACMFYAISLRAMHNGHLDTWLYHDGLVTIVIDTNLLKVAKFDKYAVHRKLPNALARKVRSFYAYQWQILKGVDETQ